MKRIAFVLFGILLLGAIVPQAGAIPVTGNKGISPTLIMTLTYFYYRNYNALLPEFNATYQKVLKLGVDNETLSQAMSLYANATLFMEKATNFSVGGNVLASLGSYRVMILVRNAYFYLRDAISVLTKAMENETTVT
ncbi:hypothetical protein [Thermococcus sp.]|uniref:hypothetical protein n=1 Tax=Thermococcus sp. TaxID=35749 RepID=UPI0025F849A2|nr:hypothetical protein [Thermococcus sp.]